MFRRPYSRHNRGRVSTGLVTPAPSQEVIIPLAGTWDGGYWDAGDGPVDVGSGKVDPWVPLEGATNLSQSSSGDRGTLTTDYFGGANAVLFNGTNEFMRADALAAILDGEDQPFTLVMHAHFVSEMADAAAIVSIGNNSVIDGPYHQLRNDTSSGPQWEVVRDADSGSPIVVRGGTSGTGAHRLIMSYDGTAVTLWDDGVKVIDAQPMNTGTCTFTNFTIACRILSTVGNHTNMAVKTVGLRSSAISDADAATLDAAWGG